MPVPQPFAYPSERHLRRHGPRGYADSQHFKPWLRDEFQFRCVYCLIRERWHPDGDSGFSVEHLRPRSRSPELVAEYDNLFYACCRCNAAKQDLEGILNPATEPLASHLLVSSEGAIHGLTEAGSMKRCQEPFIDESGAWPFGSLESGTAECLTATPSACAVSGSAARNQLAPTPMALG